MGVLVKECISTCALAPVRFTIQGDLYKYFRSMFRVGLLWKMRELGKMCFLPVGSSEDEGRWHFSHICSMEQ